MKWLFSLLIGCGLLVILLGFIKSKAAKDDFDLSKEMVVMRNIAHHVLQYTGDSTSAIAPVNRISANEYQVTFASSFSFKPDSLVKIIDHILATGGLPSDYIVNVVEAKSNQVVYGYAVLGVAHNNIVPCLGRDEPDRQYRIDVKFPAEKNSSNTLVMAGIGLLGIGVTLLGVQRRRKSAPAPLAPAKTGQLAPEPASIGKYSFYPERQMLSFGEEEQQLTQKELKILSIFAAEPNVIIDRNRIQKEVWEDEGVIVGRSLDMFISKLRKKLENDPNVKLVNIHGRGYKLEING
jgi:hypothetical protein